MCWFWLPGRRHDTELDLAGQRRRYTSRGIYMASVGLWTFCRVCEVHRRANSERPLDTFQRQTVLGPICPTSVSHVPSTVRSLAGVQRESSIRVEGVAR